MEEQLESLEKRNCKIEEGQSVYYWCKLKVNQFITGVRLKVNQFITGVRLKVNQLITGVRLKVNQFITGAS